MEKIKGEIVFSDLRNPQKSLSCCLARSQNLGHSEMTKRNRVATTTNLNVACAKTPSKVCVLGTSDLCAPEPQRRKKKGKTRTKKSTRKQPNTKNRQTTTSMPAAETQVC